MKLNIKATPSVIVFCASFFSVLVSSCQAAPLTIAAQGTSAYSIVVPKVAAVSVNEAAAEMQRDIAEATGAKLPIVKDNETIDGPFISLGSTEQAQKAGISADKIAYDGFRIVTRDNDLFIIGIDTTSEPSGWRGSPREITPHPEVPGPAFTDMGGFSNGTANGVYTFLENQLGVRWLFPGDLGRDVPIKSVFSIDVTDHIVEPLFNKRALTLRSNSDDWQARQKLGYSAKIDYIHNFAQTVPAELYEEHPDWFPMINGKRPKPPAKNYKLETTNPELVRYFAEKAIAAMKADPTMYNYSLTPSDSTGWSESPESKALYDPPSGNKGRPSVTPLVLKFYRDVSAIVAKEYPKGRLGGLLYQDFSYPPQNGDMTLPSNFIASITGKSMGYSFYRPETRELEAKLLSEWAKVIPSHWYFSGYLTWLREESAKITPAAPKELNFVYHAMVKAHMGGAIIHGSNVWSQGALKNYVHAKMLWDPTGDAVAVQHDWLMHAYGPKAGTIMETLYNKMDESWWADFFRGPLSTHYNVSEVMFRDTYGAHYPEMEKLFLEAWEQPMTEKQKQRLDLIRQNMITLQFRLRNAGYLREDYESPLERTAKQVFALFTDEATKDNFSYVIVSENGGVVAPVKIEIGQPKETADKAGPIPNNDKILLYPTMDEEITLKPLDVFPGSNFLTYYLQDANGSTFARGFLSEDAITFQAKANQPYYLRATYRGVTSNPQVKWKIAIPGATAATAKFQDNVLYLENTDKNNNAPLYVYAPESLNLQQETDAAGTVVQTQSDVVARSKAIRAKRKDAEAALQEALKRYQGDEVLNLDQRWKFITDPEKVGDKNKYFESNFEDSSWKTINAIGYWRDQGFPDYHGTAWYRKTFKLSDQQTDPLAMGNKQLLLFLGAIDGDAEIYFNGTKIEDRKMIQHSVGWAQPLIHNIGNLVHTGENTIAVKVTKESHAAGIYRGVSILLGIPPAAAK